MYKTNKNIPPTSSQNRITPTRQGFAAMRLLHNRFMRPMWVRGK